MLIWHPCNPNPAQDRMYGENVRVCNPTSKQGSYRCSVCDKEVSRSGGAPAESSKKAAKK